MQCRVFECMRVLVPGCSECGVFSSPGVTAVVLLRLSIVISCYSGHRLRNAEQTRLCIVFVSTDEVCIITVISFLFVLTNVNTNARNLVAR